VAYRGGAEETFGFHIALQRARVRMTEENFLGIPRGFRRCKKLPRRVSIHGASPPTRSAHRAQQTHSPLRHRH
ncbi:unnamed protein product, partial [Musa textilis]